MLLFPFKMTQKGNVSCLLRLRSQGIGKHLIGLNEYRAHAIGVNIYFYSCLFLKFADF